MKILKNVLEFTYKGFYVGYIWPWRRLKRNHRFTLLGDNSEMVFPELYMLKNTVDTILLQDKWDKDVIVELRKELKISSYMVDNEYKRREDEYVESSKNIIECIDITSNSC